MRLPSDTSLASRAFPRSTRRLVASLAALILVALATASPAHAQISLPGVGEVTVPEVQVPDTQLPGGGGGGGTVQVPTVPKVPAPAPDPPKVVEGTTDAVKDGAGQVTGAVEQTVDRVTGTVTDRDAGGGGGGGGGGDSGGSTSSPPSSSSSDDDDGRRPGGRGDTAAGGSAAGSGDDDRSRPRARASDDGARPAGGGGDERADGREAARGREGGLDSVLGVSRERVAGEGDEDGRGDRRRGAAGEGDEGGGEDTAGAALTAAGAGAAGGGGSDDGNGGGPAAVLSSVRDAVDAVLAPLPDWSRPIIAVLLVLLLLSVVRSQLEHRRAGRIERQRRALAGDVEHLQRALVPDLPERLHGLDVSVAYRAADGLATGGDFYDAFPLGEHRVALVLGDVSGHDRASIARATSVRHKLRAYLELGFEPRDVLRVAGDALATDSVDGEFTTAVVAVYDGAAGTLTYACAGHSPPILVGPAAHTPLVAGASPPLGWGVPTGQRQTTVRLGKGSTACLFTDGLLEARRGDDQLGRECVERFVAELGAGCGAAALLEDVVDHATSADDDLAAMVIRPDAEVPASTPTRVEELELPAGAAGVARAERVLGAWGVDEDIAEAACSAVAAAGNSAPVVLRLVFADGDEPTDVAASSAVRGAPGPSPVLVG